MVDAPYSGTAVRGAHYAVRPSVPGFNVDHVTPDPEPDPFNPAPDVPSNQTGTVWADPADFAQISNQPNLAQVPVSHWFDGQPAVPAGTGHEFTPVAQRMQAFQERMLVDHEQVNYVPDGIRLYQHATEGQRNEFNVGRPSQFAGETITDGPLAGLQNGRNAYDATNQANEVYTGDDANVGRYRLGRKTNLFGLYEYPIGKFGQDALLHAYTGLSPYAPVDKPPMSNTAPYTPNSTGTAHWAPAQPNQVPSMFALPSETAITDYSAINQNGYTSDFIDEDGGFM
jgi:hypothetical protein